MHAEVDVALVVAEFKGSEPLKGRFKGSDPLKALENRVKTVVRVGVSSVRLALHSAT